MAAAASALPEPQVLAHAKRRLFPDDANDGYAVVDTQFASGNWLSNQRIEAAVTEELAPFNHVRVGSGYPDLVGVRSVSTELLETPSPPEEPPLIVVEAKGDTERGTADVDRGIIQAYDRLQEANAAYVAAPNPTITQSSRSLARELNVGILGVTAEGRVDPIETPRIVGNRSTSETTAIRFQASPQRVTDRSFALNHPKNYLAYPLAVQHDRPTDEVMAEYVVKAIEGARSGAEFLDLIADEPNTTEVTPLGREVVRFGLREYGSIDAALRTFEDWKRSVDRFSEVAPRWGILTRRVVYNYPATQLLVEELQALHDGGNHALVLPELVQHLHESHPTFTVELFVRGTDGVRNRVLNADGELRVEYLSDGNIYHSPTVFQLKAMLYHAGILTKRGAEPSKLEPTEDVWALREVV